MQSQPTEHNYPLQLEHDKCLLKSRHVLEYQVNLVDTDDLNDGVNRRGKEIRDDLHYSASGYVELGKRFAKESIQLIKDSNEGSGGE